MKLVIHSFLAIVAMLSSLLASAASSSSSSVVSSSSLETKQKRTLSSSKHAAAAIHQVHANVVAEANTDNNSNNNNEQNHHRRMNKKNKKKKKKKKKNEKKEPGVQDPVTGSGNSTSTKSSKKSGSSMSMYAKSSKKSGSSMSMYAKSSKSMGNNSTNSTSMGKTAKMDTTVAMMRSSSFMSMMAVVADVDYDDESPTFAPTLLPTMMPTTTIKLTVEPEVETEEVVVDDDNDGDATVVVVADDDTTVVAVPLPICPTAYDVSKTTYAGGDKVEMTSHLFECKSLLVQYCNIGAWDDSLLVVNANAEEMWSDAWVHVGPCSIEDTHGKEKEEVVVPSEEGKEVVMPIEAVVTVEPTTMPTFNPTVLPTGLDVNEAASAVEEDTTTSIICPVDYDTTRTDYIGGDFVTVDSSIFECNALHVKYCNIAKWDDSLLVGDVNAEELWDNSWVFVKPCV
jgi:hypothetical protein